MGKELAGRSEEAQGQRSMQVGRRTLEAFRDGASQLPSPQAGEEDEGEGVGLESPAGVEFEPLLWRLGRFCVVMALLLSLASLPFSSFFEVREVRVEGNSQVPAEEISAMVRIPEGKSIFQVDQDSLLERVLAHPGIRRAMVFPDPPHRLIVRVEERRPFISMEYRGRTWVLDEEGVVMGQAEDLQQLPRLPVRLQASSLSIPAISPGRPVPSDEVRKGLAVLRALPEGVEGEIRELTVTQEGFVLRTREGIQIRLGRWKGISRRLSRLLQVLEAVRSLEVPVESVDLRFGDTVVINPLAK